MSIRSDVAVALKKSLVDGLTEEQKTTWFGSCHSKHDHAEGTLYHWEHTKWYYDCDDPLYEWLSSQNDEDFLVVVACHDYPESAEGSLGAWRDNPWNIYRRVSVSINIDTPS